MIEIGVIPELLSERLHAKVVAPMKFASELQISHSILSYFMFIVISGLKFFLLCEWSSIKSDQASGRYTLTGPLSSTKTKLSNWIRLTLIFSHWCWKSWAKMVHFIKRNIISKDLILNVWITEHIWLSFHFVSTLLRPVSIRVLWWMECLYFGYQHRALLTPLAGQGKCTFGVHACYYWPHGCNRKTQF